jgi:hypothetical protein
MEQKLSIAEILKNKPRGTKLYSMIHGKCSSEAVTDEIFKINFCTSKFGLTQSGECTLIKFGNMYDGGKYIIFPSKEMRDWSKFSWQKGDVLISNDGGTEVIFDKWYDDTYTSFYCKHYLNSEDKNKIVYYEEFLCTTERYSLENMDAAQTYIKAVEERCGGKLNKETLEVEKSEFKDWDFITIKLHRGRSLICVFKAENDENYYLHASLDSRGMITINEDSYCSKIGCIVRLSTEEEKTAFFDALAKRGKIWDVEKKKIIALKKKWTPKPFDRVITRNADDDIWTANIFSHMDSHGEYVTIGCVGGYTYCIPYNEETAKLIGTTNNVEG